MKPVKSLAGVLEYDAWRMRLKDDRHCALRLTLFDLPIGGLLLITTECEVTPGRYLLYMVNYGAKRHPIRIFPDRRDFTFTVTLAEWGKLSLAVYTPKARPGKDEPLHSATYRIDPEQKRPVRAAYHKVTLHVEDEWREEAPHRERPRSTGEFPQGSLFV